MKAHYLMPKSLRLQLLSRSLTILAVLLLLIGIFQYAYMRHFLYNNKATSMQNQLISVPNDTWQRVGQEARRGDPVPIFQDASLAFVGADGSFQPIGGMHNGPTAPQLPEAEYREMFANKHKPGYKLAKDDRGNEQIVVVQAVMARGGRMVGAIEMSSPTKPLRDVLLGQLFTFLSLSALALGAGLLAFIPVLRRTLVPLSNIVRTVERIDAGSLNERLPAHQGQTEIDQLSKSFNHMLERLELSFEAEKEAKEQMRRFIADASHELRTPLTSIHGFLEVLLRGAAQKPEQLNKALVSMYGESGRLTKLVHDLLLLARLDRDKSPALQTEEGALDAVVHDMEPQLRLLAGDRTVTFALADNVRAVFDPDKIKQVVLNLFHNAVQHTDPHQGVIAVTLERMEEDAVLTVTDNGAGIPEQHLAHLFERFYRVDTSRSRKLGGAGLGLSISKSIVDHHGGSIEATSREGEGSSFRVRLPAAG